MLESELVNRSRIVVVGSLNSDLVAFVDEFPGPGQTVSGRDLKTFCGGKGANQAYAAARLGVETAMIGQVGKDAAGSAQVANLAAAGVDTSMIVSDPIAPTGTAVIAVDSLHENRIIVIPGANGAFTPDRLAAAAPLLASASFVLLQLEIPLGTVQAAAKLARGGSARVILDPAPARPLPDELLQSVDYLTPNLSELASLAERPLDGDAPDDAIAQAAKSLCRRGVPVVIAKLGARGAMLVASSRIARWHASRVAPVDTTAAGDCFNAAFAAALVDGMSELDAGRFACVAAGISVTRAGAQPSMPGREEVLKMFRVEAAEPN